MHSKAGALKNTIMELPLKASVAEIVWISYFFCTSIIIFSVAYEIQDMFYDTYSTVHYSNVFYYMLLYCTVKYNIVLYNTVVYCIVYRPLKATAGSDKRAKAPSH